jgi:hypothetical protein
MLAALFLLLASDTPAALVEGPVRSVLGSDDRIIVDEDDAGVAFQLRWVRRGNTVASVSTDSQGVADDQPVHIVTYRGEHFLTLWTYWASGYGLRFVRLTTDPPTMTTVGVFENGVADDFSRTGLVRQYPRHVSMARSMETGHQVWVRQTFGWNQSRQRFDLLRETTVDELPPSAKW